MVSPILTDHDNRVRLSEYCASLTDGLMDLAGLLVMLSDSDWGEDQKHQARMNARVLALDILADVHMIAPMLIDIGRQGS